MTNETEAVARILREAARTAIMPRFRRLAAHERREKAPGDEEAEEIITAGLATLAPGTLVVGEEATAPTPPCWPARPRTRWSGSSIRWTERQISPPESRSSTSSSPASRGV